MSHKKNTLLKPRIYCYSSEGRKEPGWQLEIGSFLWPAHTAPWSRQTCGHCRIMYSFLQCLGLSPPLLVNLFVHYLFIYLHFSLFSLAAVVSGHFQPWFRQDRLWCTPALCCKHNPCTGCCPFLLWLPPYQLLLSVPQLWVLPFHWWLQKAIISTWALPGAHRSTHRTRTTSWCGDSKYTLIHLLITAQSLKQVSHWWNARYFLMLSGNKMAFNRKECKLEREEMISH